mgnify:CR=1 FL=1
MSLTRSTFLLFLLNFFDAVLTIYWVRNGFATEANHLMAGLLDLGNAPFLTVKIAVGATAALVLSYWGHLKLARYGVTITLAVYLGLMVIHMFTGLSAFGLISDSMIESFTSVTSVAFAFAN